MVIKSLPKSKCGELVGPGAFAASVNKMFTLPEGKGISSYAFFCRRQILCAHYFIKRDCYFMCSLFYEKLYVVS